MLAANCAVSGGMMYVVSEFGIEMLPSTAGVVVPNMLASGYSVIAGVRASTKNCCGALDGLQTLIANVPPFFAETVVDDEFGTVLLVRCNAVKVIVPEK